LIFIVLRHTKNGYQQTIEKIYMDGNELSSFLIDKPEKIQDLINEFEMNNELREKGFLSLDGMFIFLIKQKINRIFYEGFRNMLLSENFDIINSFYSRRIYQDMTRYKKNDYEYI